MQNLANSYDDAGRNDEALAMREVILDLRRMRFGPEHVYTIGAMHDLANSYSGKFGREKEAQAIREEVLELSRKVLGPEHPDTLTTMHNTEAPSSDLRIGGITLVEVESLNPEVSP